MVCKQTSRHQRKWIIKDHYKTSFDQYHDKVSHDRYHFETDFNRFVKIHKILEKKSTRRPLWFHYRWENTFKMRRNLKEINSVYNGKELNISADLRDMPSSIVRFFSDHDLNLKITCLSLWNCEPIPLNEFPKLETFYGGNCEITVDHTHPSLKTMVLQNVPFSTLPVDLERLVARNCHISMEENHPQLEGLRVLDLQNTLVVAHFYSKNSGTKTWKLFRILKVSIIRMETDVWLML